MPTKKKPPELHTPTGFAAMTPERRKEIAQMGGRAVPKEKRTFARNPESAAAAGRKGGIAVPAEKRSFSRDPEFARAAGRKGGEISRQRQLAKDGMTEK